MKIRFRLITERRLTLLVFSRRLQDTCEEDSLCSMNVLMRQCDLFLIPHETRASACCFCSSSRLIVVNLGILFVQLNDFFCQPLFSRCSGVLFDLSFALERVKRGELVKEANLRANDQQQGKRLFHLM